MTRTSTAIDRVTALLVGAALLVVGAGAILWNTDLIVGTPDVVTAPELVSAAEQNWWPWAVGAGGVVLTLLAIRWLFTHLPQSKVNAVHLDGSGDGGTLTADLGSVARAAAHALEDRPGVHTAKGKAITDWGTRTIELHVTVATVADLPHVTAGVDEICRKITHMIGDPSVATRTHIHFDKTRHHANRVS